jgi:PAS domain S-box-containing protein
VGPTNRTPVRGAARLAAILDALPDALLLVDASGSVVNANSAALTLFEGESAERLLGKAIAELLPGIGRTVATPGSAPAALPAGSGTIDPRDLVGAPVRRPPERMAARRTDGSVFPAEVTAAELTEEDESELNLLVVRDLTGVLDVEAELRRQQRQIELILRAASEGIIGVDHEGRIVLVNPAGAKILRYRAADLGGQNVHELLTHSRADGTPLPESECPLLDSVRTGAKHRAVDSVLWRSDGGPVYVDLTTAPVYEGENIIGAVMTFVDNSAARTSARQAAELTHVLDKDLRSSLVDVAARLREIADYAESEYAASGYGSATLPMLEEVGADLDLDVDAELFIKLLTHLLADMVAVSPVGGKIVLTAARRGALARIEIRGPHTGGGPLHLPIAQAIAARHGGTVTTHRIAGKGNTHVIEVPVDQPNRAERPARPQPKAVEGPVRSALPTRVRGASGSAIANARKRPAALAAAAAAAASPATAVAEVQDPADGSAEAAEQPEPRNAEVPEANGQQEAQSPRRRRAAPSAENAELQARIPAQSRSTLARSVGSIADLRPSRPMPTGDVWSKPDRSLTSEPAPGPLAQSDTQWIVPVREDPLERSSDSAAPAEPEPPRDPQPWQPAEEPQQTATPEPDATQRMPDLMQPPSYVAPAAHGTQPRGRRRAAQSEADLGASSPSLPQVAEPEPVAEPAPQQQPVLPAVRRMYALPATAAAAVAEAVPIEEPEPAAEREPGSAAPRLLLWPDPDRGTSELLRTRGYDPVSLGQPDRLPTLAANGTGAPHPFAVFVDPISAPITRRGLREVRAAATRAGLPLLVTAGIGRSPDGRDLGPDPSLLLTALCPTEVRLPRVLLVEARPDLADAITDILEAQGMQVAQAATDAESRESAVASPPDLVLLDLMQIRRRRIGVVDWLRDRGLLARTPLVVYTAEGSDAGGFDTLYLTERATDSEPASRIGDLLAKIAP